VNIKFQDLKLGIYRDRKGKNEKHNVMQINES